MMISSEFNIIVSSAFKDVALLYNAFSGSIFEFPENRQTELASLLIPGKTVTPEELSVLKVDLKDLLDAGVVLVGAAPDGTTGERDAIRKAYHEGRSVSSPFNALSLTISPTVSCNFRCGYCFEAHPNRHFTEEDIKSLSTFVKENLQPGGALNILWIGGEPLARFKELRTIHAALASVCAEQDSSLSHTMISNGYLLKGERLAWAIETGLGSVQVTLDGPKEKHDRRRPLLGGKGTFDTILDNLSEASRQINIDLRINVDRSNVDDLPELLDLLQERGLNHRHIRPYLGWVRGYTDETVLDGQGALSIQEYAAASIWFRYELVARSFGSSASLGLPTPRNGAICTADSPAGFVVSPGRLVFGCWNETADSAAKASFTLDAKGKIQPNPTPQGTANRDRWTGYDPFSHAECQSCKVQPLCRGGCPWIARERANEGPGDCTPLRYTLAETVRLAHLLSAVPNS